MATLIQLQQQFHEQRRAQRLSESRNQTQFQPMDTSSSSTSASEIGTPNSSNSITSVSSHSNPNSPKSLTTTGSASSSSTAGQQVQSLPQNPPSQPPPAPSHFSCAYCNKTFEKKSSRNRHANNCKTKPAGERLTKQKSCVHCVKTKTRCDTLLPKCSRCRMKGLECRYVHKSAPVTLSGKGAAPRPSTTTAQPTSSIPPLNTTASEPNNFSTTTAPSSATTTTAPSSDSYNDVNMYGSGQQYHQGIISPGLSGDNCNSNFNFDWQLNSPVHTAPMLLPDLFGFPDIADQHDSTGRMIESASTSSRTSSISSPCNVNMLGDSPRQSSQPQYPGPSGPPPKKPHNPSYEYVKKIIRSFPTMMLRTSNLPPFVNHYMYTSGKCGTALSNCTSIMQMNKIKTRDTRELVWRVIEMECGRIMKEYTRYNDLELLGATQAIVMYVVLWCMEDDPNIKSKFKIILYNMHELCQRLVASGRYMCKAEVEGRRPVWEEWLFFESIRRTAALLYILDLLYDISYYLSKSKCDGLFELPLPATKNLWNASKRSEWEEEYDWILSERRGKGMLKYEVLLMASSIYGTGNAAAAAHDDPDLNLWYANIDEYGMMVSLIIN